MLDRYNARRYAFAIQPTFAHPTRTELQTAQAGYRNNLRRERARVRFIIVGGNLHAGLTTVSAALHTFHTLRNCDLGSIGHPSLCR